MTLSPSRYERRTNKADYARIDCPGCEGGYVHRGRPYPMACTDCERTGYVYIRNVEVWA